MSARALAFWLAYGDGIEGAATTALQRVAGHLYCVITAWRRRAGSLITLIEGIEAYAKAEGRKRLCASSAARVGDANSGDYARRIM